MAYQNLMDAVISSDELLLSDDLYTSRMAFTTLANTIRLRACTDLAE